MFAEPFAKEFVGESYLGLHDLNRSEVHAPGFAKVGVVRLEEMFIEVQPRVVIGTELARINDCDGAFK